MAVQSIPLAPVNAVDSKPLPLFLDDLARRVIDEGYAIDRDEARRVASIEKDDAMLLFHYASRIRKHYRADQVSLCSIVNAKSGACSEDCTFCAQSAHFKTESPVYGMMKPEEALEYAKMAKRDGAEAIGIVISGYGIKKRSELDVIGEMVRRIKDEVDIDVHGSFGILKREHVEYLRECGVTMINHNLETSERHYGEICTTHTFQDRIDTIKNVKECGLKVCAGGIFGMQENIEDRIDMAFSLRELDVDVVPLNFLHPIHGTPLMEVTPLSPIECLMIISLYRFILPTKEIKICGGREKNLRDLQSLIFHAGADSMMIGNYLTTAGREPELDWRMMRDLELNWSAMDEGQA